VATFPVASYGSRYPLVLIAWAASGKAVKGFFSKIFEKLTSGF
jgi:hypothetical protein